MRRLQKTAPFARKSVFHKISWNRERSGVVCHQMASALIQRVLISLFMLLKMSPSNQSGPLIKIQTSVWGSWPLNGPRRCNEMTAAGWVCLCWQSERGGWEVERGQRGEEGGRKDIKKVLWWEWSQLPIYAWIQMLFLPLLLCVQYTQISHNIKTTDRWRE